MSNEPGARVTLGCGLEAKARRVRKPNLARAIKEAVRAGLSVTGATIEAGRITLHFSEPRTDQVGKSAVITPLDTWRERRRGQG